VSLRRLLLLSLVLLGPVLPVLAKDAVPVGQDPAVERRMMALSAELRCLVCQNQTIADSQADLAGDLRQEIRELVQRGQTDQQIKDYMVARYGDFILFRPRYSWRNAWLWGAPVALLLVGAWVSWRVVRQRTTLLDADQTPVEEDGPS